MELKTDDIWKEYYTEIFFFILKRVKNKDSTNEIIQNSFIKIHNNLKKIRHVSKIKPWVFQIARNEIINFYNQNNKDKKNSNLEFNLTDQSQYINLCCFDKFVNELPEKYKAAICLIYFDGKKISEAAKELEISLANAKARIRRGKDVLKENFTKCCKFSIDKNGKLMGESNCIVCDEIYS
jgi:RNA polymerase sigma-70 factor (ECF subfamily)